MTSFIFKKIKIQDELNKSFKVRKKVFCEEQNISEKIEFDNLDHLCDHYLIYDGKKAIATGRVRLKNKNSYKIERVAVLQEYRRLKIGSLLINEIVNIYKNVEDIEIILHSQHSVENFYKSLNFVSYGEVFFEDGIPHIAMKYKK
ncbi:MAG: GNAT family N-acetyltransferase [Candidatus Puniceispirillales bacterium]|jgi:predicted GNAT family N-acyltransferase